MIDRPSPRLLLAPIGAGLAFVVVVVLAVKLAPEWLASTDGLTGRDRAEEIGRVRTALLATLAGLIAIVGAYYTARTFQLNQQGQITERFTRAVEQLGHSEIDVRLGGIYALERLARESPTDHGPIIEILTAYVREHAPAPADILNDRSPPATPATDISAVLNVLRRRNSAHDPPAPWRLDLGSTCLAHAELSGTDLRAARLNGTDLRGAALNYANLERTNLTESNLTSAKLSSANLEKARLSRANLRRAALPNAKLRNASLVGAILEHATLTNADLSGADLRGANLTGVRMLGVTVRQATYDESTIWPDRFDPDGTGAVEAE